MQVTAAMFPLKMSVFGDAAGCCGGGARTLRAGYPLCVAVLDFLRVHYAGSGVRRPSVCQYDPTLESGVRFGKYPPHIWISFTSWWCITSKMDRMSMI